VPGTQFYRAGLRHCRNIAGAGVSRGSRRKSRSGESEPVPLPLYGRAVRLNILRSNVAEPRNDIVEK